jgi:hypothetical protein
VLDRQSNPSPLRPWAPGVAEQPCPAIVHLRIGVFAAERRELGSNGIVTFTGRLRTRHAGGMYYRAPRTRSHRLGPGEWIEWLESESVAA